MQNTILVIKAIKLRWMCGTGEWLNSQLMHNLLALRAEKVKNNVHCTVLLYTAVYLCKHPNLFETLQLLAHPSLLNMFLRSPLKCALFFCKVLKAIKVTLDQHTQRRSHNAHQLSLY